MAKTANWPKREADTSLSYHSYHNYPRFSN